jgi:hypothetical protein
MPDDRLRDEAIQSFLRPWIASLAMTELDRLMRQNNPTGKSLLIFRNRVKPGNQKYSAFAVGQISGFLSLVSFPIEGRLAIVTDVGNGMRWTHIAERDSLARRAAFVRTTKSASLSRRTTVASSCGRKSL